MKKQSALSSASRPESGVDAPLLFIDRCAWSRRLDEALLEAAIPFVAHRERFAPACPDTEWLAVAGRECWIVITRDQAIRRKSNELQAFRDAKLIVFALASGNATAEDTARLVVGLYPRIIRRALGTTPPAMFSVTLAGGINPVR